MNRAAVLILILCHAAWIGTTDTARAGMAQLDTWTLVQDPPHPHMSATVINATEITLVAAPETTAIPAGTDVGFQSVNGTDVLTSTQGTYFSRAEDFSVAIDFDLASASSIGFAGIGFGIGEDINGANSAGIGLAVNNGQALAFAGASRIGDATQSPLLLASSAVSTGRLFVEYQTTTGDVTVGVNSVQGSNAPTETRTFAGIQNAWNDQDLLVSFFLRSDAVPPLFSSLSAGTLSATFSNLEVIGGTPISVPEPATLTLLGGLGIVLMFRRSNR